LSGFGGEEEEIESGVGECVYERVGEKPRGKGFDDGGKEAGNGLSQRGAVCVKCPTREKTSTKRE